MLVRLCLLGCGSLWLGSSIYIYGWNVGLSSYTLTLFSTAKLSGAPRSDNGNIEIYVFLEKYLHDFQYKNMLRISMELAFDFT
jgi:hypothetical protein